MRWLPFALLVACDPMPPTGAPLQPVPAVSKRSPGPPTSAPGGLPASADEFDFVEDEGTEPEPSEEDIDDPATLLALAQGLPIPDSIAPWAAPVSVMPVPIQVQSSSAPIATRVWTPGMGVAADWGVRVVSTVVDSQPPRAILGLPNGTEVVVQPGTMLAESRLVVMAVGRDVVQVSRVVPEGYQARIETRTLRAFYPVLPPSP